MLREMGLSSRLPPRLWRAPLSRLVASKSRAGEALGPTDPVRNGTDTAKILPTLESFKHDGVLGRGLAPRNDSRAITAGIPPIQRSGSEALLPRLGAVGALFAGQDEPIRRHGEVGGAQATVDARVVVRVASAEGLREEAEVWRIGVAAAVVVKDAPTAYLRGGVAKSAVILARRRFLDVHVLHRGVLPVVRIQVVAIRVPVAGSLRSARTSTRPRRCRSRCTDPRHCKLGRRSGRNRARRMVDSSLVAVSSVSVGGSSGRKRTSVKPLRIGVGPIRAAALETPTSAWTDRVDRRYAPA